MRADPSGTDDLLAIERLSVAFATAGGPLRAVDEVSLGVPRGKTVGLVGESGSGKSVTALSVLGLLEGKASVTGRILFDGEDLRAVSPSRLRSVRGRSIGMIFQDPSASLNPTWRIGSQIAEPIRLHEGLSRRAARERAHSLLQEVGIPDPGERIDAYPHQLSGGMRQRVMIAIALACAPRLLIADEPTTALDVTIQAQIVDLLKRLQRERGMGMLFITHDLGLVAEVCDEMVVMYAGQVVERGTAGELLGLPLHPYTSGLLASMPISGRGAARIEERGGAERRVGSPTEGRGADRGRITEIPGTVPDLRALPPGCRFQDRCPLVRERCREEEPPLARLGARAHRCHFPLSASESSGLEGTR